MRRFLLIFLFLFSCSVLIQGQNITSRIQVRRGHNLSFIFNSYSRFLNGITFEKFTQLNIYFNDTTDLGASNPTGTGWQLTLKTLQPNLEGDMTASTLMLNTIQVKVWLDDVLQAGTYPLSAIETQILSDNTSWFNVNRKVEISYECGTVSSLLNKMPDFYNVDIEFTLKPLP